jgi:hypothetical protein
MGRRARTFYAAYRPYGLHALNRDGTRADVLHGFAHASDRTAWVEADPGRRETLPANAPEVRAALTFEARQGYRVIEAHEAGPS